MRSFEWSRKGLVYEVSGTKSWSFSHAQVPTTVQSPERIRVYFSTREMRDAHGNFRAHPACADFSADGAFSLIQEADAPLLAAGERGTFDEHGIMVGTVLDLGASSSFMYYCGWSRRESVPYDWAIGLATCIDDVSFVRIGSGPIIGARQDIPFLIASPHVFRSHDSWHMFFLGGLRWHRSKNRYESQYVLRHALSIDGIEWTVLPEEPVTRLTPMESQATPTIIMVGGIYVMFFAFRDSIDFRSDSKKSYRIGCALSRDLFAWTRHDEIANFGTSSYGWDSEMVAYPHLFWSGGELNLLYCGNSFGERGFGRATATTIPSADFLNSLV